MTRKWYDDECELHPMSEYKILSNSMFLNVPSDRLAKFSEDMFKKAIKLSKFKSLDTLKIVMSYVKEINYVDSNSYVVQCENHAYVFSSEDIARKFLHVMEFMNYKFDDSKYDICIVYKSLNKDVMTFEICKKYGRSNRVYLCIDTLSEYIGMVRGLSKGSQPEILVGESYWFKFSEISYEKLYEDLIPRIEANLDDEDTYYSTHMTGYDVDSVIMCDILKCFGAYRRGKFNMQLLEASLYDNDIEEMSLVKAKYKRFSDTEFNNILSKLLRSRVTWQYVEPVSAFDKYSKNVLYYNNCNGNDDYLGGLACQVED